MMATVGRTWRFYAGASTLHAPLSCSRLAPALVSGVHDLHRNPLSLTVGLSKSCERSEIWNPSIEGAG
jgi:hypothetical protein